MYYMYACTNIVYIYDALISPAIRYLAKHAHIGLGFGNKVRLLKHRLLACETAYAPMRPICQSCLGLTPWRVALPLHITRFRLNVGLRLERLLHLKKRAINQTRIVLGNATGQDPTHQVWKRCNIRCKVCKDLLELWTTHTSKTSTSQHTTKCITGWACLRLGLTKFLTNFVDFDKARGNTLTLHFTVQESWALLLSLGGDMIWFCRFAPLRLREMEQRKLFSGCLLRIHCWPAIGFSSSLTRISETNDFALPVFPWRLQDYNGTF